MCRFSPRIAARAASSGWARKYMAANPETINRPAVGARTASAPAPRRRPKKELTRGQRLYKEWGATAGLLLAATVLVIGYMGRDSRRLFAEHGLGYALGIIGSLLILTLLLYPLRKRFKILKFIGPVKDWFRVHMMLGVVGPIAVLYHSNFSMGSVNSTAALFAMLLVAGSGLVGRFLYSKVHHGLYGRKANLKELLAGVKLTAADTGGVAQFVPNLLSEVAEFDRQVLKPPKSVWQSILLPMRLSFQTRAGYRRIVGFVNEQLEERACVSPTVAQQHERLLRACSLYVKEHLRRVRRVATFAAYERLFSLWHKVHLPFFYLLLITAIVHVIAVHAYSIG